MQQLKSWTHQHDHQHVATKAATSIQPKASPVFRDASKIQIQWSSDKDWVPCREHLASFIPCGRMCFSQEHTGIWYVFRHDARKPFKLIERHPKPSKESDPIDEHRKSPKTQRLCGPKGNHEPKRSHTCEEFLDSTRKCECWKWLCPSALDDDNHHDDYYYYYCYHYY